MNKCDLDYIKSEDEKNEIRKFLKNYKRVEPLEVLSIENGIVLPRMEADSSVCPNTWMGIGGVLDSAGNFVKLSGIKALWNDDFVFGGKYEVDGSVEECAEDVVYMGVFKPHWGHFLLEYCTRLWYPLQSENKYKIVYCGYECEEGTYPKAFREFFELLGIREQLVDIRKPTRFRKIIIPEQSFLRNQYFTKEYRFIFDIAYQNIKKSNLVPYDKIYFSRVEFIKNSAEYKERGEQEIQDIFEKNGYKIFAPEKLTVSEQIFYIRNCKVFVGILGSVSASFVFASDETDAIYIRKAPYIVETFQIDQAVNAGNVTLIDCYFKPYKKYPRSYGGGPHFIGVTKELRAFLKNNGMKQLSRGIYGIAKLKTWCWLTKMVGRDLKEQHSERKNVRKVRSAIELLLKKNVNKIIIYPYGAIGRTAKGVLDEKKIDTYLLVDHYKSLTDKSVYDVDILRDSKYSDYWILVCSDVKSDYYQVIRNTVYDMVDNKERVVEIF